MTFSEVVAQFCDALSNHDIPFVIGGSIASSTWGVARTTHDADLEVWISPTSRQSFLTACTDPFQTDAEELDRQLTARDEFRMVQVMQWEEGIKFDCFLQGNNPFDSEAFEKAKPMEIIPGHKAPMACPEHILVRKLRWYELGDRVSERQWRDIVAIARVTTDLDWQLVKRWAPMVGVNTALAELREELRLPPP